MKVWSKIILKDQDKQINLISKSLTNYLYKEGPINEIIKKYNIDPKDKKILDKYTTDRVSGLLLLYAAHDINRINDIANKYNNSLDNDRVSPEIEGYINR